jgi:DHA1 family bicyclomycin/chloramphenicol resistance-like MFS transporter
MLGMSPRRTAIIGGLMVTTGPLSLTLYGPALPSMVTDLATSDAGGKLTMSVYFAAFALSQLICGPLSDRFGRRWVGVGFFIIYVLGSLVGAFAPTLEVLLFGRLLQGFGVSAGVALSRAMVRDQFIGMDAIRILTMVNLILTVAPAISPTLGSLILLMGSWHLMFLVMAGFGLAIIALLCFGARETLPETARTPLHPRTIVANYGRLLTAPDFLLPALVLAMAFGGFYGFSALLPFLLIDAIGLTPFQFAMAMLIQTGSFITGNVLAGRLARNFDGPRLILLGLVFLGLGGLGFAILPRLFPDAVLASMAPVSLWMLALAAIGPSATASAMARYGHIAGAAGALTGFFQMGGGFVASILAISLFPDALTAITTLLPILAVLAIATALLHRRLYPGQ